MIRSRQRPRVGGGSGASGSLALRLDFMSSTSLDQRITFSRGTNATLIDSTGKITYAPSNQFTNSESFGNITSWPRTGLSATTPVVSNAIAAPNGTITADKIAEDGAASAHYLGGVFSSITSVSYTTSIYAKAAERQYVQIILVGAVASPLTAGFDLSGSGTTVTSAGSTSLITSVGDGWYRCSITATATVSTASASIQFRIATSLSTAPANYLGTDGSGLYLWGAQIGAVTYETAPRAYNSTSPKNLLGFTEEFNNAAWTKTNSTITTNAIADPNGYLNADKILTNATLAPHSVGQNLTVVSGQVLTASVYVKAAEYNFAYILLLTTFAASQIFAIDLTTGAITTTSGSPLSTSVTNAGNGWWRISITQITNAAGTATMQVRASNSGTTSSFSGDVASGIYVWGAQISDSASVDPYVYNPAAALTSTAYYGPRFDYNPNVEYSTNNLLEFPTEFSNAAWQKGALVVPIVENTAMDPTGYMGAEKLVPTTASTSHSVLQTQATTMGTILTGSVYVKADGYNFGAVLLLTTFAASQILIVNLLTGAITLTVGSPLATSVTDAGNGWWRISITQITNATGSTVFQVRPAETGGTTTFAGDGTSGIYAWGAQLTESAAPVPFFYYPLNPLGLLIEEARTNLQTYSDQIDNATGWARLNATITTNTTTSPDGTTNADALIPNATSSADHYINSLVILTTATQYTISIYAKPAGYNYLLFRGLGLGASGGAIFDLSTGTVIATNSWASAKITAAGNGWYRCTATGTSSGTAGPIFGVSNNSTYTAYSGDGTSGIYMYGAQVEANSFATSYIPTSGASVTRSADIATMVGNNFTNWYNQDQGTFNAKFIQPTVDSISYPSVFAARQQSANNSQNTIEAFVSAANSQFLVRINNVDQVGLSLGSGNTISGTNRNITTAYKVNNFASSYDGTATLIDTNGIIANFDIFNIGWSAANAYVNTRIKSISYYNARLPDAQLQALTA